MTILPTPPASGAFAKFHNEGDSVVGHLLEVRGDGSTMQGEACPLLVIDTDEGPIKVTCAQQELWSTTVELYNAGKLTPGCRIRVTYTKSERRPNGHTLKRWEVKTGDADPAYAAKAAEADEPF